MKEKFTRVKRLNLDNLNSKEFIEQQYYQDYLREENKIDTNDKNTKILIEKILTNKRYTLAIQKLSEIERKVFYLSIIKSERLDYVCNRLKLSRNEVIEIKKNAQKHFIENLKNGGADSE